MMKKEFAALTTAAVLTFTGCSDTEPSFPIERSQATAEWHDGSNGSAEQSSIDWAKECTDKVTAAAAYALENSDNPVVVQTIEDFQARSVPAVNTSLGPVALNKETEFNPQSNYYLMCIDESNPGVNPVMDGYIGAPAHGVYNNELRTLFIYPEVPNYDIENAAQVIYHEATHAENHHKNTFGGDNEEAITHEKHQALAEELYGEPYRTAVNSFKDAVRSDIIKSFSDYGHAFIIPVTDYTDMVQGAQDNSNPEWRWLNSTIMQDAIFEIIDENTPNPELAQTRKTQIYNSLAQNG